MRWRIRWYAYGRYREYYFICFKKEPRVAEIGVEKGKRKKYEEKRGELEGTEILEGDTKREEKETTKIRKRRKRGER
jgi:hypothetical protein